MTIISLSSCKSLSIVNSFKKVHISGLPNVDSYKEYTIQVKATSSFKVNTITLFFDNSNLTIDKYSFINLKDNKGHMVKDSSKSFEKGDYKFSFRLSTKKQKLTNEYIEVKYVVNEKLMSLKTTPVEKVKGYNK
ncbi:hypothetical protein [Tenacibaculum sp. nBUS_03]|uniref:hypothetical protein n=1 Tax=Tenacibaculum sp. nBUS_03 TaxID=3395320 RepID=UPI003EC13A60